MSSLWLLLVIRAGHFGEGKLWKSPARRGVEWRRDLMLDDFVFGVGDLIHQPHLNGETPTELISLVEQNLVHKH